MNDLVYLDSCAPAAFPYTTSEVIAEFAQVKHHAIQQLISKHENDLLDYGNLAFEMRKLSGAGRPEKIYRLNEQQATVLITYLKNTEPVRAFKKELVRQFFAMRDELYNRRRLRAESKPTRRELTDVINDCVPDSPHKRFVYKQYTDLMYKLITGKTAAVLRREHGADKTATAADLLTADELAVYNALSKRVGVLIELGMSYNEIKQRLTARPLPVIVGASAG